MSGRKNSHRIYAFIGLAIGATLLVVCLDSSASLRPASPNSDPGTKERSSPAAITETAGAPQDAPLDRAAVTSGQAKVPAGEATPELHGRVVDIRGTAVAGVRLICRPFDGTPSEQEAISGNDGRFALRTPPSNGWHVAVASEIWTAVMIPQSFAATTATERLVVVAKSTALNGTLVDADNTPVPGAAVRLSTRHSFRTNLPASADGSSDTFWQTETDANGAFVFPNAPAIDLSVEATSQRHGSTSQPCSPPFQALALQFESTAASHMLTGLVLLRSGSPASEAVVALGESHVQTNKDGRFRIALNDVFLAPGKPPVLRAGKDDFIPAEAFPIAADWRHRASWPSNITLRLDASEQSIRGRTFDATGAPIDAEVGLWNSFQWPQDRIDKPFFLSMSNPAERSDSTGRFEVTRVTPGKHRLRVFVPTTQQVMITAPIAAGTSNCSIHLERVDHWPAMKLTLVDRRNQPIANCEWHLEAPLESPAKDRLRGTTRRTGADGIVELQHIARTQQVLVARSNAGMRHQRFRLEDLWREGSREWRLKIPRLVETRIAAQSDVRWADSISMVDDQGEPCSVVVTNGTASWTETRLLLLAGKTRPFRCPDNATAMVMYAGEREVWRKPITLSLDTNNVIRL